MILLGVELLGQRGDPPGRIDRERIFRAYAVAVGPVGGDARLRHVVHLAGADLHLHTLAVAA